MPARHQRSVQGHHTVKTGESTDGAPIHPKNAPFITIKGVAHGLSANIKKLDSALRHHIPFEHKCRSQRTDETKAKDSSEPCRDGQPSVNPLSLSVLFQPPQVPGRPRVLLQEVPQWWNMWGGYQAPGLQQPGCRTQGTTPIQIVPPEKRTTKKKGDTFGRVIHGRKSRDRDWGVEDPGRETENLGSVVCVEITKGRRRVYRQRCQMDGELVDGLWAQEEQESREQLIRKVFRSYLLPQGFPESVAPQYAQYMSWRGVQYFFGGAMSVFTTKSLLSSLGVAGKRSGEAAAAINWVLKDGAGRVGRLLFARWGRALDSELKQFRLGGDLLMELGAAMELSTVLMPRFFLPLACTANLSKNLAAVAASSTRAPIYRNFALQNNMADVTAKGESVANLADIMGTLMGIALSKTQVGMLPTFLFLSTGYLFASRKEIDSVELPYLNRARLSFTASRFLETGTVPGIAEANRSEPLLPWGPHAPGRIVLGASVADAFDSPSAFQDALNQFSGKPYIITYRPCSNKVYVLLRDGVRPIDVMESSFTAHIFQYFLDKGIEGCWTDALAHSLHVPKLSLLNSDVGAVEPGGGSHRKWQRQKHRNWKEALEVTCNVEASLFGEFRAQALERGWKLHSTTLNANETRLVSG